jgi:Cyclin, N-terminal domain
LTGVAAMFIACKYEEIYPLHLSTFYEKIGHKKLSKEDIKRREQDILHAINFELSTPSIHDFITVTVKQLNLEALLEPTHLTFFKKMCSYLSKLACHEYKI